MTFIIYYKLGDVLGSLLDIENEKIIFYLNGVPLPPCNHVFKNARYLSEFYVFRVNEIIFSFKI
jgi:hypothetical protein